MKLFDENAICVKCGSGNVASVYYEEDRNRKFNYYPKETKEHIERQCRRCHFRWNEAPLDAAAAIRESDK